MKPLRVPALLLLVLISAAILVSCAGSGAGGGDAVISEKSEVFKTYPFGDPDPVPIFARSTMWGAGARLYPYYFFNKFSGTGADQEWPVVRLENPYISVAVLPKVGGKVWGATDKTTGKEFLYTNHVLKFREIALRGPWTSGGIEFNFGIVGHSPATATPVDYVLRRDPDGSVSCVVGAMDLPSRTRWSVTIRLPKDKGYFDAEGLDVVVDQGTGSAATVSRIASGTYDAGFGDMNAIIQFAGAKPGEQPVMVYRIYNTPPFALIVKADSPIRTLKDVEGKTLGSPAGGAALKVFTALAKKNGIDEKRVTWLNMAPNLQEQMLVKGDVDF